MSSNESTENAMQHQAIAAEFIADNLVECCSDLVEFHDQGVLRSDSLVRKVFDLLPHLSEHDKRKVAQEVIHIAALREVASHWAKRSS